MTRWLFCQLILALTVLVVARASRDERERAKRQVKKVSVCPEACSCEAQITGEKVVDCYSTGKESVPVKIPADVGELHLGYNSITEITDQHLYEFRYLRILDLSHNRIRNITETSFKDLGRLTWLDLSYNQLFNFTANDLGQAGRSLKVLNISNANLGKFPKLHDDKGKLMTNLVRLDLSYNLFTSIPRDRIPTSVQYLDISCLQLKSLPDSFENLHKLKELKLTGCDEQEVKLTHIRGSVLANLAELTRLDLSGNHINVIPAKLPENLVYLKLSNNRISRIKSTACATEGEMQASYMTQGYSESDPVPRGPSRIGSQLSQLILLGDLELDGNKIERLCRDDFLDMHNLKVLNLSNSRLISFPRDTFLYAESLTKLDLSMNNIRRLEMDSMPDLQELYLQHNYISEVRRITTSTFPALLLADFSYNKYECDCNLKHFIQFLAYSPQATIIDLHANSNKYLCAGPSNLQGINVMRVDIDEDLVCGAKEDSVPLWAILAPVSLVALICLIIITICVKQYRLGKSRCCCVRPDSKNNDASDFVKYDEKSDIVIKNLAHKDAAILCHTTNHKWVQDAMMPKLQENAKTVVNVPDVYSGSDLGERPLNIDVITIGKTIKMNNLQQCIDSSKKIALVITHEFLEEKSCLYILQVVLDRMAMDPRDAVVVVMLDAIQWSDLPNALQRIMVEKSFVQYPHKERGRQELYFWETLCSLICTSNPALARDWPSEDEDAVENETVASFGYRSSHRDVVEFPTIRSSRRSRSVHDELPSLPVSATRAARLQRLGIKSNGEVIDDVMNEVAEARNLAKRNMQKRELAIISRPALDGARTPTPSSRSQRLPSHSDATSRVNVDGLDEDIDNLYSRRKEPVRNGGNHRVRSLLPPNCEDADSVYSDDDLETPIPGYEMRPPERHCGRMSSRLTSAQSHFSRTRSNRESMPSRGSRRSAFGSRHASVSHNDVIENLHGTVDVGYTHRPPPSVVEMPEMANNGPMKEDKTAVAPKKEKKKWNFGRLKSFF